MTTTAAKSITADVATGPRPTEGLGAALGTPETASRGSGDLVRRTIVDGNRRPVPPTAFAKDSATTTATATVTSAHPLSDDQIAALKTKLTAREGRTVMLSAKVDPDLLGGLVVTIGSQRIDASIRTRLNSLAKAMQA